MSQHTRALPTLEEATGGAPLDRFGTTPDATESLTPKTGKHSPTLPPTPTFDDVGFGDADAQFDRPPAVRNLSSERDVRFDRATTTGRYRPSDPQPDPQPGVHRHPRSGQFVPSDGKDPGIERDERGRFTSDGRRRRR